MRKDPTKRLQHTDDVKLALDELKEESDSGKLIPVTLPVKRYRRGLLSALVAVPFLVAAGWLFLRYSGRKSPPPVLVQLTSYPGSELEPCFSPDGEQLAFAWNGEQEDNCDIFVKLVGETNTLRLTTDPVPELWPAWSPGGKRIAFQRIRPGTPGVWVVFPLGGAEHKLADLQTMGQMSWSPDGKWLAVARGVSTPNVGDTRGIFLVPIDGGVPRRLSNPKEPAFDIRPSFSPDGRQMPCTSRILAWSGEVSVQQLDSGYAPQREPRQVTRQSLYILGLAWSRDGRSLVYSGSLSYDLDSRLWRVRSSGGQAPERLGLAGFSGRHPSIAPSVDRLAFSWSFAINPRGTALVTGDKDGVVRVGPLTGEEPHLLFGHTGPVTSVAVSPDGRWIASGSDDGTIRLWPMPDLSKRPLHTLPHDELLAKLKSLTNLRAVRDPSSHIGWKIEIGPFPGWKDVPIW